MLQAEESQVPDSSHLCWGAWKGKLKTTQKGKGVCCSNIFSMLVLLLAEDVHRTNSTDVSELKGPSLWTRICDYPLYCLFSPPPSPHHASLEADCALML